ncbi:MAG: alpha/beta hydrolase, partial [Gemmatimonadaceae bacterium]
MTDLGFIHRFVPADSPSGETLLVLHGTGGNENDLIGIGQAVAPGAAILSPRGNVLENGAPRFFRRLAEGVFDPKEVRSRAEELARFIRAAVVTYRLDASRVFALGYSNGANVASTVMLIEPGVLQGAVLFRPMLVYEPEDNKDLSGSALLLSAGRMDPIVPTTSVERLVDLFQSAHADVILKWQLAAHNLLPSEVREAADW